MYFISFIFKKIYHLVYFPYFYIFSLFKKSS
ncbi:hypothetical protein M8044_000275 [Columbia Basin potato purple top phytoplasma]|uniref:Uncharacterized protein n=1 Tax=Columbia Basin potato purple top phytoplasma TaxID=307134 RepID=A0ABT5L8V9_9MOLU|nr:hypothetical protein [Columbia Basin potato purple top phytoplasma]